MGIDLSSLSLKLLKRAKSVLQAIVSAGLDETIAAEDAKHVVLTNTLALITILLLPGYLPILLQNLPESRIFLALVLICIVLYPLILVLNALGHRLAAKIYYGLVGVGTFITFALLSGRQSNMHLYLVLVIVVCFFIFSTMEKPYMFAVVTVAFVSFIGLEVWFLDHGALIEVNPAYSKKMHVALNVGLVVYLTGFSFYIYSIFLKAEEQLQLERRKSDDLLHNILPAEIAARLKARQELIADRCDAISILFADLVGFTALSERICPEEVVQVLNEVFSHFDMLAEKYGLEKIKTIGDAYMVVGGLPTARPDHAEAVAEFALEAMKFIRVYSAGNGETLNMRVGINCGPVVAGVIGKRKFSYDLWGDTVNTAARMESHGVPGKIQVTAAVRDHLQERYRLEGRGPVQIKGKGVMETYFLEARNGSARD